MRSCLQARRWEPNWEPNASTNPLGPQPSQRRGVDRGPARRLRPLAVLRGLAAYTTLLDATVAVAPIGGYRTCSRNGPNKGWPTLLRRSAPVPCVLLSVPLAGPVPSGSTCTTRHGQGRLPPSPAPPRPGCPQLRLPAATRQAVKVSHLHLNQQRLHGALGGTRF